MPMTSTITLTTVLHNLSLILQILIDSNYLLQQLVIGNNAVSHQIHNKRESERKVKAGG